MTDHGTVRSTVRPKALEVDDYSVWVASGVEPIQTDGSEEQPGGTEYEYNLVQYEKDEYIQLMDEKNASLEEQMESTQEALDFLLLN